MPLGKSYLASETKERTWMFLMTRYVTEVNRRGIKCFSIIFIRMGHCLCGCVIILLFSALLLMANTSSSPFCVHLELRHSHSPINLWFWLHISCCWSSSSYCFTSMLLFWGLRLWPRHHSRNSVHCWPCPGEMVYTWNHSKCNFNKEISSWNEW